MLSQIRFKNITVLNDLMIDAILKIDFQIIINTNFRKNKYNLIIVALIQLIELTIKFIHTHTRDSSHAFKCKTFIYNLININFS